MNILKVLVSLKTGESDIMAGHTSKNDIYIYMNIPQKVCVGEDTHVLDTSSICITNNGKLLSHPDNV